jgi:hypothetical protein
MPFDRGKWTRDSLAGALVPVNAGLGIHKWDLAFTRSVAIGVAIEICRLTPVR